MANVTKIHRNDKVCRNEYLTSSAFICIFTIGKQLQAY